MVRQEGGRLSTPAEQPKRDRPLPSVAEPLDVADDSPGALQRVDRDTHFSAQEHGVVVEQEFDDLSGLVPHAQMVVIDADDCPVQLPHRKIDHQRVRRSTEPHDATSACCACRPWKTTYRAGRTMSVSAAAAHTPPMTTTAGGRC